MLPFSVIDDINFSVDKKETELMLNTQNNVAKPSEVGDNLFECFNRKGLHFIHINARSLFHKISELKILAQKSHAAVICVTESWLNDSYPDASVSIDGYILLRKDRKSHGGGVCAYIRDDLAYNQRPDLSNLHQ